MEQVRETDRVLCLHELMFLVEERQWEGKLLENKVSMLPKAMYRFHATSIQLSMTVFEDIEKESSDLYGTTKKK